MMHRFRDLILMIAVIFAGIGGYLIRQAFASSERSYDFLVISGACCCAIAAIVLFRLFLHGRDPGEPKEE